MAKKIVGVVKKVADGTMVENNTWKFFRSPNVNFNFNKINGFMQTWGDKPENDPTHAPFPFILDIEITTNCYGPANKLCGFCYKNNNPNGHNMTLEQFKNIIDKMPWLTQCALGADAQGVTNPEMYDMMAYARSKGIIPNLTIADVSEEVAGKLAAVAGAVAVSVYHHAGFDVAFDSVARLAAAGMKQINFHYMISEKTIDRAYDVIKAMQTDPRLVGKINAIVFLSLKQKGRGVKYDYVTQEQYKALVDHCLEQEVPFGFDSCSASSFLRAVEGTDRYEKFKEMSEDCESTCFSSYINEKGEFFPCSFTEGWSDGGWGRDQGINVLEAEDFIRDVWNHPRTVMFRDVLTGNKDHNGCRNCPAFDVCGIQMRHDLVDGEYVPHDYNEAVVGDIKITEVI